MLGVDGKTEYRFTITNAQETEKTVQDWLSANGFQQMQEDGAIFYRSGDAMISGYRFFEYTIRGLEISIYAYLGSYKKPKALADGLAGALPIIAYKNALDPLFSVLSGVVAGGNQPVIATAADVNNQQNKEGDNMQTQQNNTYNNFQQAANKRNDKLAEISFWISILMLISSFLGVSLSAILMIVNYFLAAQGLKSQKRSKAIAAIVMTSLALVVIIISLASVLNS